MRKHTSLYLDVLRVLAALAVFFSHITRDSLSGGNQLVAFLGQFGQEGVAVFFVISGIVIAFVSRQKEHDFRSYLVARLGRLWSVMIPALLLTVVLDTAGRSIAPGMYAVAAIPAWGFDFASMWNFFGPLLFLNKIGFLSAEPGTNGPFWSLCYEFWYYALFGIAFYLRGVVKIMLLAIAAMIAGPGILMLSPIWAFGLLVFTAMRRAVHVRVHVATWIVSCMLLLGLMAFKYKLAALLCSALPYVQLDNVTIANAIAHFAVGMLCAANILIYDACGGLSFFQKRAVQRVVRYLAARSFSLYLYQAPCLFFFGALTYGMGSSMVRLIVVVGLSLGAILLLAEVTEKRKKWFVTLADRLIPGGGAQVSRAEVVKAA